MFSNVIKGVEGYLSYRGGIGHLSFLMQRVSGLGTLIFLSMHILLESTAHFAPHLYDQLNAGLRTPVALIAETVMAFLVIYHGVNGYRIAYFDLFRPNRWTNPSAPVSARTTWIISFALWIPSLVIIILHGTDVI